jgi:hypothetical protein
LPLAAGCGGVDVNDAADGEEQQLTAVPVLHMTFSGELSPEEADAEWQAALQEMQPPSEAAQNEPELEDGPGSRLQQFSGFYSLQDHWTFSLSTRTGTGKNDGTDGRVEAIIKWNSGFLSVTTPLNNPGNDREPGDYDYYLFHVEGQPAVVAFHEAIVRLKGTDGWDLEYFYVHASGQDGNLYGNDYNERYKGYTRCTQNTRKFLDSDLSSQWDQSLTTNCSGLMDGTQLLEL